ncbi:MAG: Peptidase, S51 family [Parcubacteria group bacterium GW2011_GWA1_50_14]|uniref:Peptidase E n=1 Tax=Candidatus Liptonbacteria bacterium GWB1_49_6 TaxID=1798644 RepID=A0A1G2C760_9BACT|nr:MAG: Peptidase, S51 family [Parcubacteria group bacterium GW2011_GWA1_50_14]OGY97205.1 MAG: hypothetical protein A2122_02275 [Candidatus Liptonbacteria bacterium GWB1_49_6]
MKILLASNGKFLIEEGYKLLGIPRNKIRIGYITTASKGASSDEYIKLHQKMMEDNGYSFEEIDVENRSEAELRRFFGDKNIVHMEGGNTYYLLQAIKKSGFDEILRDLLNKGIIYVGTSAGSSIAGPTIELSSHIPEGTPDEELSALNLVPFLIKCHYTDDKEIEYKTKISAVKYPVKFLRDGQGLLVEDGKCTFLGKGEKVEI